LNPLTDARVNNPKQIYDALKKHVDAAAGFNKEYGLDKVNLNPDQISSRVIQLAIPNGTKQAGWEQIDRAIDYGKKLNIEVKVTIDK